MNIFDVLSQGKGRLNEENLSAILAFLLSPNQTHGLGDIFLRHFLKAIAQACGEEKRFNSILNDTNPIQSDILLNPHIT
ncbi:MAG: PD-(D/E)XK nuclease family protein [Desulfobacteraceae bacterium]|uniref:PD-(D/E)XK nuclease family protein n=1 Tax=Candidatus Desulfacyla euxinica TaxID=2841693 RepID=A0A8J6MX43_9DELT|nr:PD-(D/E)XK nuclease family protein [Candidatus Desulfacyla euxinica]MBL6978908.1 PD-(D/E)XK nuclease family protein [Desulfobacteraceae bacterium]